MGLSLYYLGISSLAKNIWAGTVILFLDNSLKATCRLPGPGYCGSDKSKILQKSVKIKKLNSQGKDVAQTRWILLHLDGNITLSHFIKEKKKH